MQDSKLPPHALENRRHWDAIADDWAERAARAWVSEPTWGNWQISEAELRLLPDDLSGLDAIELGCGTAYFSAWLARRGARVVGIDNSERQLATARALAEKHDIGLTLIHGNAEQVPYPNGSFDLALSEYGAAIWCDPFVWVPEVHRLLRPGGVLLFLGNSPFAMACAPRNGGPVETILHQNYFGMHRFDWTDAPIDPGGITFNLPISGWVRLFRETGFEVLDYRELQAPADRSDTSFTPALWAHQWPSEQIWKVRKR